MGKKPKKETAKSGENESANLILKPLQKNKV
jgi:hypothetical protein